MNVLARIVLASRTGASAPEHGAPADGAAPDAFADVLEQLGAGATPPPAANAVPSGATALPGPASAAEVPEPPAHDLDAGVLRGGLDLSAAAAPVLGEAGDAEAAGGAPPLDRPDPSASTPVSVPGAEVAAQIASAARLAGPVPPTASSDGSAPGDAGRVDPRVRSRAHPHAPHERTQDAFRAPSTSSARAPVSPPASSAPDARTQETSYPTSATAPGSARPLAGPDAGSPAPAHLSSAAHARTGESSPPPSAQPGSPRSRPAPSARWSSSPPDPATLPFAAPSASTHPPTGAIAATLPSAAPAASAPPSTAPSAGTPSSPATNEGTPPLVAPTAATQPSTTPGGTTAEPSTLSSTADGRSPQTARPEPVEGRATRGAPEAPPSPPLAPAPSRADAAPAPQAQRTEASTVAHGDPAVRAGAIRGRREDQAPHAARARPDATPAPGDGQPNRLPIAAVDGAAPDPLATDALGAPERGARDPARARESAKRAPGARDADADGRSAVAAAPDPLPPFATAPLLGDPRTEAARPRTTVAPPIPVLPIEPGEAIVSGAVLPSVAHLHLSSETLGEVALHLRILDGAAHVRVEGGPRGAVEPRAPELARALAAEGLHLARLEHEPNGSHSSGGGGAASSGGDLPREGGSRDASGHTGGDAHHGDRQSGDGATARPASSRTGPRGSRKHGGAHDVTA